MQWQLNLEDDHSTPSKDRFSNNTSSSEHEVS